MVCKRNREKDGREIVSEVGVGGAGVPGEKER